MDELFTLHQHTVFLRPEALAGGYTDSDLAAGRRHGFIRRVRQGAYVSAPVWDSSGPVQRFRIRGRAVALQHGESVMLSHTSAAAEHGLDLYDPDLSVVHVTRLDGRSGRIEAGVCHHTPVSTPDQVERHGEIQVQDIAGAAIGTALLHDVERGLVVTDSLLNRFPQLHQQLVEAYHRVVRHPRSQHLQIVIRLTQPGAQSVLETRCRFCMWRHHLPKPELQFEVYDEHGVLIGITDFAWPAYRLLGEADGQQKYGRGLERDLAPDQVAAIIRREKRREDLLREATGYGMIRYINSDLRVPAHLARRTNRMLGIYAPDTAV